MSNVAQRFIRYATIDTQSHEGAGKVPSTSKQFELADLLCRELKEMGADDVFLDRQHCYVYATIPATTHADVPVLGFIAHLDTSPAVSGTNVNPTITENYNGGDIKLNYDLTLSPRDYPELLDYIGMDIITTDGSTLLGADDKAGIAEIMEMARILLSNEEIVHGKIRIAFTPDEEIGSGVDFFDVAGFGADYAYTVDGGKLGEICYENFNAATARVTVNGTSIHTGDAKGKMINSVLVAMEFQKLLPEYDTPAATENYEGFFHLDTINGNCDSTKMLYIIRDHDRDKFAWRKALFLKAGQFINDKYGDKTITIDVTDSFYNMRDIVEKEMHLIDNAKEAMRIIGVEPIVRPIRGGTDGARLSFMGLPCPNLGTGAHNMHGRYEYIPVQSMEKVVELLLKIAQIYSGIKQ